MAGIEDICNHNPYPHLLDKFRSRIQGMTGRSQSWDTHKCTENSLHTSSEVVAELAHEVLLLLPPQHAVDVPRAHASWHLEVLFVPLALQLVLEHKGQRPLAGSRLSEAVRVADA